MLYILCAYVYAVCKCYMYMYMLYICYRYLEWKLVNDKAVSENKITDEQQAVINEVNRQNSLWDNTRLGYDQLDPVLKTRRYCIYTDRYKGYYYINCK